MELRVNDYVRFKTISKEIKIGKVIEIIDPDNSNEFSPKKYNVYDLDNNEATVDDYIIKSSPNIIDLIEVGDVLVVKDFVDEACMIFTDIYLIQNEQQLINIKSDLEKNKNKKLYSIVTSEQFSQMEYKID